MKRMLAAALALTLIILALPRLLPLDNADAPTPGTSDEPVKTTAEPLPGDKTRSIRLFDGEQVSEISVFDYLTGVLAAEMPVSFEPEALKAQAVAARSYLQRGLASPKHEGADICTSADCCQAYLGPEQLRESWGENYELYIKKITAAVEETDGQYLSYDGQPALAAFHSSSDGATEDSGAIWNELPYLVSVDSPETADSVPNFVSSVRSADIDFRDTILYLKPEADMTGDADSWVGEVTRSGSGRVDSIVIGGVSFSGSELRKLFSLRSTDFELSHSGGEFVFTVKGYGHGVGMSQYGANEMAKSGASYREILMHYYPGTTIC